MHLNGLRLPDAKRAVGRLVLDRRIPPAVEVKDVIRLREIEPGAAGLEREDEEGRPVSTLEGLDHLVALGLCNGAVQEIHVAREAIAQAAPEEFAHLGKLRKN